VFDARGLTGLREELQRSAENATTAGELFAAYRRAVAEIADALARPRPLYADRSLRRAEQHMRRHFGERLGLARIARIAGFSPTYFSELFRKKQGVTFEQHLLGIRIERAKQLLGGTSLSLQRVAALCGLSTRNYLGRVFKRVTGETPMGYRRRVLDGLAQPKKVRQLS
jgi:AraC-like DNA-binding protein